MRIITLLACLTVLYGISAGAPNPLPDTGWTGDTQTPDTIGSSGDAGYEAQVAARWDIVPYQEFNSTFNAGVVAFHMNGIEKVSFAVDGGDWVDVTEMTLNPRTDVYEYWVTLRAEDFATEGKFELRAIAYPKSAGEPRVLSGMELYADKGGYRHDSIWVDPTNGDDAQTIAGGGGAKDKPFKTLSVAIERQEQSGNSLGGATFCLEEGEYGTPAKAQRNFERWMTFTAAPGANPANVKFVGRDGRCDLHKLRLTNVTWAPTYNTSLFYPAGSDRMGRNFWLDNMDLIGIGRADHGQCQVQQATVYETNLTIRDMAQGVYNIQSNTPLVRNVHVECIKEDAFRVNQLLINVSVNDVDNLGSGAHPDVIQAGGGTYENFIVYNLKATNIMSQGIYMGGYDWALVNVFIEQEGAGYLWQIDGAFVNHGLLWHCGTVGQSFTWRTGDVTTQCRNISIRNCAWQKMSCGTSSKGAATDCDYLGNTAMIIDNNHFIGTTFNQGTNATTGDVTYADAANDDYRPADGSALVARAADKLVPCDVDNNPRADTTAIGAFCGETEAPVSSMAPRARRDNTDMIMLAVSPNPFRSQVRIVSGLVDLQGPVSIRIFDPEGKPVRVLSASDPAGAVWDGKDDAGKAVPNGQYYLVITSKVRRYLAPVVLMR